PGDVAAVVRHARTGEAARRACLRRVGIAKATTPTCSPTRRAANSRHWIARHEDRALDLHAVLPPIGVAEVHSERAVAGPLSPDHHMVRVALVFRDVVVNPIDSVGDVAAGVVPIAAAGVPLNQHADKSLPGGPAADVVVERVALAHLLLDLVAGA